MFDRHVARTQFYNLDFSMVKTAQPNRFEPVLLVARFVVLRFELRPSRSLMRLSALNIFN